MTVPYATIEFTDGMYIASVKGVEVSKAATAQKCSAKLAKYIKGKGD